MFHLTRAVVRSYKQTRTRRYPTLRENVRAGAVMFGALLSLPFTAVADVVLSVIRLLLRVPRILLRALKSLLSRIKTRGGWRSSLRNLFAVARKNVVRASHWVRDTVIPFLRTPRGTQLAVSIAIALVLLVAAAFLTSQGVSPALSFILAAVLFVIALRLIKRRFKIAFEEQRRREEDERKRQEDELLARRRAVEEAEQQRLFQLEHARQTRWLEAIQKEFESHQKARLCSSCQKVSPDYLLPRCPFCETSTASGPVLAVNGWSQQQLNEYGGRLCRDMHNHQTPPFPIIQDTIVEPEFGTDSLTPAELQSDFDERFSNRDFIGIGNLALSVLLDRMLLDEPDAVATLLASLMPKAVAEQFDIPASLTYACPHRDIYLPALERGNWTTDTYPHLIILAYVLDASWRDLPVPHGALLPYYLKMAERQTEIVKKLRDQLLARAKEVYTADDI